MSAPVTILSRPQAVRAHVQQLQGSLALDTEFHAEARFQPELMWIQLADCRGVCVVVDAQAEGATRALIEAIHNRDVIVHAGMHDFRLLSQVTEVRPKSVFDTQIAAGLLGLRYPMSLSRLVERLLNQTLPPSEAMSDWSQRPMASEQLAYACADVAFLHPLRESLLALPQRANLLPLEQCCQSILEEALREQPEDELWKRFHAASTLDAHGREILRLACMARRTLAREQNRGERQICSDSSLVDLAKRKPESLEALNRPRNVPRKLRGSLGEVLVDCVKKALLTPLDTCPQSLEPRPGEAECRLLLEAWSEHCFRSLGLSPRLLLPASLRTEFAQSWAEGRHPRFRTEWRIRAAGERLEALFSGHYRVGKTGLETPK